MKKRTRNVLKLLRDSNIPVGRVDIENVAFSITNNDVLVVNGFSAYVKFLDETVYSLEVDNNVED